MEGDCPNLSACSRAGTKPSHDAVAAGVLVGLAQNSFIQSLFGGERHIEQSDKLASVVEWPPKCRARSRDIAFRPGWRPTCRLHRERCSINATRSESLFPVVR